MLEWLLSTEMGPPGPAGDWPPWLSVLFHSSNLVIGICYLAVPAIILANWKYRRDGISGLRLWSVLAFLPAQAASRLARVFAIYGPAQRLTAILDFVAAVAAMACILNLRRKILHILRLPSRSQVHELNNRLQVQICEKEVLRLETEAKYEAIRREADLLRRAIQNQVWLVDTKEALARIEAITSLLNKGGDDGSG